MSWSGREPPTPCTAGEYSTYRAIQTVYSPAIRNLQSTLKMQMLRMVMVKKGRMLSRMIELTVAHCTTATGSHETDITLRFLSHLIFHKMGFKYRTKKQLSEYWSNTAIGLQLSCQHHWTSDSPIAMGLTEIYWKKRVIFTLFLCIFSRIFAVLPRFSQISASLQPIHYSEPFSS